MITLNCLASGSTGNCYVLGAGGEKLLIECGIPIKQIKIGLDFDISAVQGCIVTHHHQDHAKSVSDIQKMGIPCWLPYLDEPYLDEDPKPMKYQFGVFTVTAVPLFKDHWLHTNGDGSECPVYGFLIDAEGHRIAYFTDYEYLPMRFTKPPINAFLIACNHDDDMEQDSGKFLHSVTGHSSLKTVCGIIDANKTAMLTDIILCHISRDADPDRMIEEVRIHADPWTNVYAAAPGITTTISAFPF